MRLSSLSDRELVNLYQAGKEVAFEELLSRYKGRVFAKIMVYVRDRKEAENLFQDTFVRAIVALKDGNYYEDGKFGAWILRIANNLCIDYFRNRKKMPMVRGTEDYDIFEFVQSPEKNIEENEVRAQVLKDAKKLLEFLPQDQREMVMMRLYYDMSFKEIAETLDISINTALGRMRYALINLRKLIEKHKIEVSLS
jgi:RNA polymerase sigma factor (sigma-70 family)